MNHWCCAGNDKPPRTGVGLERAHVGIFTELAILYAKYRPEKLMEHCKAYMQKLNTTKLLELAKSSCCGKKLSSSTHTTMNMTKPSQL